MKFLSELLNIKEYQFKFENALALNHIMLSPLLVVHRRDNSKLDADDEEGEDLEKKKEMDFKVYELD